MAELNLDLHPKQLEIYRDPTRFKVVCAGRRTGKTHLAAILMLFNGLAHPGGVGWAVAPSYSQTMIFWRKIRKIIPRQYIKQIREGDKCIILKNDYSIWMKSGDNPDSLRGEGLDYVVLDEYATMKQSIWTEAIRPALGDKKGSALFIGCVTKDTMIIGDRGVEYIGEAPEGYSNEDKQVFGLDNFNTAINRYGLPKTKTIKLKTKYGFAIECTQNHQLWTIDGWKRADSFSVGDEVQIQFGQQVFGNRDNLNDFNEFFDTLGYRKLKLYNEKIHLTKDVAYLLGLYLAEGCSDKYTTTITSGDQEIADLLLKYGFRDKGDYHYRLNSLKIAELIKWFDFGNGAKNKHIPNKVLEFKKEYLVEFLKGYFDGDGYSRRDRRVIGCTSISEELSKQIQILLLNFGILSKKHSIISKPTKLVKAHSQQYPVTIEGYGYDVFYDEIGFRLSRKQKIDTDRKPCGYPVSFKRSDLGTIPTEYGYISRCGYIRHSTLFNILDSKEYDKTKYRKDMLRDTIQSIEVSESEVYDFVIPKTHSYFSNGFVSHNTPAGKNHFYELAKKGMSEEFSDYKYFHGTSFDNTFIDPQEFVDMAAEMPEIIYKQEILAEFIEGGGEVFGSFEKQLLQPSEILEEHIPECFYVCGLDIAKTQDFTVLRIMRMDTGRIVFTDRFNQRDWGYQIRRIKSNLLKYNNPTCYVDSTGVGDPIYEKLRKEGLNVKGVVISSKSKPQLIENLSMLIEEGRYWMPDDKFTREEYSAFTYKIQDSGYIKYAAADGYHDDIVMADALCAWGLKGTCTCIGMMAEDNSEKSEYGDDRFANYDELESVAVWG